MDTGFNECRMWDVGDGIKWTESANVCKEINLKQHTGLAMLQIRINILRKDAKDTI